MLSDPPFETEDTTFVSVPPRSPQANLMVATPRDRPLAIPRATATQSISPGSIAKQDAGARYGVDRNESSGIPESACS